MVYSKTNAINSGNIDDSDSNNKQVCGICYEPAEEPVVNPIIPCLLSLFLLFENLNFHCMYEVSNVHLFCALVCSSEFEICPFPSNLNLKRATKQTNQIPWTQHNHKHSPTYYIILLTSFFSYSSKCIRS